MVYEIDLAYDLGITVDKVHAYHYHPIPNRGCVRCRITGSEIGRFLDAELSNSWFGTFRELRNQIVHRNLPVISVDINLNRSSTEILLPDNPTNTNPQAMDYSQRLEVNRYCLDRRGDVVHLVESAYSLIGPPIRIPLRIITLFLGE